MSQPPIWLAADNDNMASIIVVVAALSESAATVDVVAALMCIESSISRRQERGIVVDANLTSLIGFPRIALAAFGIAAKMLLQDLADQEITAFELSRFGIVYSVAVSFADDDQRDIQQSVSGSLVRVVIATVSFDGVSVTVSLDRGMLGVKES